MLIPCADLSAARELPLEEELILSDSWKLTRHPGGVFYAFPVLMNRCTEEVFGPKETVPAPECVGGTQTASELAAWLIAQLPPERHDEARAFLK